MAQSIRGLLLPPRQRRTLDELTSDLDLRSGDQHSKQSAFWTMLAAGILSDSTATVIGAMIIAPLSTPIMGIALSIAKREPTSSTLYVVAGSLLVVLVGVGFAQFLPTGYDLLGNSQIAGRTSPGIVDLVAAAATGLAGAVALARRDVAAVLPGVAIAISLVPPLAVVGVCLGRGAPGLALGASLLFVSNLLALVLAGTLVFTALGYATEAISTRAPSQRRAYLVLSTMVVLVMLPLLANTVLAYALTSYSDTVEAAAVRWVGRTPGASVTAVERHGLRITVLVRAPGDLPPTADLLADLHGKIPDLLGVTVVTSRGTEVEVRPPRGAGN
jgi:uncharacterized hydrophobic protein (TIGR00271 family)